MKKKEARTVTLDELVEWYEEDLLTSGERPHSVYAFAKAHGFAERAFYDFFGSFEVLEQGIFVRMMEHTLEVLHGNAAYEGYGDAEKLSAFYFTFFEMATANRSLVMHLLGHGGMSLEPMGKLRKLREHFLEYVGMMLKAPYEMGAAKAMRAQERVIHEGAWLQFMSILRFWMSDTSPGFEKTDVLIEKSVRAGFDLVYQTPMASVVDFGKFVWKEMLGGKRAER